MRTRISWYMYQVFSILNGEYFILYMLMAFEGKNFTLKIVTPISEKNLRVNYDKRIKLEVQNLVSFLILHLITLSSV